VRPNDTWHATTLESIALCAVYVLAARAGLAMDAVSGFATLVWPPTGLCLAALVLRGGRLWPGVFAGAAIANVWVGATVPAALGVAAGNTVEALLGAWALRRVSGFNPSLERLADVAALILASALGSTLVSATVGTGVLTLAGKVQPAHAALFWRAWWVGDLISALVLAPAVLTWSAPRSTPLRSRRIVEGVLLFSSLVVVGLVVFGEPFPQPGPWDEDYLFFPLLIWAAVRFGVRGAASASLLLSVIAIWGTATGGGPFTAPTLHQGLLNLQLYVAVCAGTFLVLGAASSERRQALADRERLISIASHELRTPLSALQLMLHRLRRRARSGDEVTALESLQRQTDRVAQLIDSLLDISRITAGKIELHLEEVDLAAVARDTLGRYAEGMREAGTTVTLSSPPSLFGRWDRLRLEQVISNLLSNAQKYGGAKPVDLVIAAREGGGATIEVIDRGVGIARHDQGRIFQPFQRLATVPYVGGFGLGLWIVRQIVEALGGKIGVNSTEGAGSTFTIVLPASSPASAVSTGHAIRGRGAAREA
jgi:signal transduction histidine kinase